ncbi:hypothetical protein OG292_12945 [Streptomyces sp. NBC_01511]|uniref:hypothetical protein n=1 Tax=unclassified Streptomyces TaxID=2593676 RepID=UPI00386E0CBF
MSVDNAARPSAVTLVPPLTKAELDTLADELVYDTAPRLFAVVQSYEPADGASDEADAWVAAWGLAFDGCAEIVSAGGGIRMRVCSPDRAVRRFGRGRADLSARLVWVKQPSGD